MSTLAFTPQQQAVIEHAQGHAKVVAVAGAGKTTTLTHFIQRQLERGQNPRRMLVIMYNKSAQQDFTRKLSRLRLPSSAPQIRTFHALGLRIYRTLIERGYLSEFQGDPISQSEMEFHLWRLMQQKAPSHRRQEILQERKKWVDPMMSFMEQVKSSLEPAAVIFKTQQLPDHCRFFVDTYTAFEQWRKQQRRISYADMLHDPCTLFSQRPDIAQEFSNHMDWILVDEYQDINGIQQFLLEVLAGSRANVMVIGDPDQTIYEYRGSNSDYMVKHFDERFQNPSVYPLTTSFRYGHQVALLAGSLIQKNQGRLDLPVLAADSNPKTQVQFYPCMDEIPSLLSCIESLSEIHGVENVAVLYRLWGMSAPLELALLQRGIAYDMPSQFWVLERSELQNFMLLFELASGDFQKRDRANQYRMLLNFLLMPALKIKRTMLDELAQALVQLLETHSDLPIKHVLSQLDLSEFNHWQKQQIQERLLFLELTADKRLKGFQLVNRYVRETDFYKGLSDGAFSKQQADDRIATVQGFVRFMMSLNLKASEVIGHFNTLKHNKQQQITQGIKISSIHRAKGLEWSAVVLPSVSSAFYPYEAEGEMQQSSSVESERRLFYVAMTRAKQSLHVLYPQEDKRQVSPFLSSPSMLQLRDASVQMQQQQNPIQISASIIDHVRTYCQAMGWALEFQPIKKSNKTSDQQQAVRHTQFGDGQIVEQSPKYLHIRFEDGQVRTLDRSIAQSFLQFLPN